MQLIAQPPLYPISKNGKWGLVDNRGNLICKPIFDYINYAENGKKYIYSLKKKKGLIHLNGTILTPPIHTDIILFDTIWSSAFYEGNWNLFNNRLEALPHQYKEIIKVENDLFLALNGTNSLLIQPSTRVQIKGSFVSAKLNENCIITVNKDSTYSIFNRHTLELIESDIISISRKHLKHVILKKNNSAQFFNPNKLSFRGKKMKTIKFINDDSYLCSYDKQIIYFLNSNLYYNYPIKEQISITKSKFITFIKKGKQGIYDLVNQKIIIPAIYDYINYNDGFFLVRSFNKYGCYSKLGHLIVPCKFESFDIYNKCIVTKSKNKQGVYSINGEKIEDSLYNFIKVYDNKIKCYTTKSLLVININSNGSVSDKRTYQNFMSISIGPANLPKQKFQNIKLNGNESEKEKDLANNKGWFRQVQHRKIKDSIVNFYGRWGLKNKEDSICIKPKFQHIELINDYNLTKCYLKKPYQTRKVNERFIGARVQMTKNTTLMYNVPFSLIDHTIFKKISKTNYISLNMNDFNDYALARGYTDHPVLVALDGKIKIQDLTYYGDYQEDILTICQGGKKNYHKYGNINKVKNTSAFIARTGALKYGINENDKYMSITNGAWYYIDKNGNQLNEKPFQFANNFVNGKAIVKLNNKWGVIDTSMNVIVPIIFDNVTRDWETNSFNKNYYFKVENRVANNYFYNKTNGHLTNTKISTLGKYYNGIWTYKNQRQKLWGLIDTSLNTIADAKFSKIKNFTNQTSVIQFKSKKSVITTNGKIILPYYRAKKITPLTSEHYAIHQSKGIMIVNLNGDTLINAKECKMLIDWNDQLLVYKNKRKAIQVLGFYRPFQFPKKTKLIWISISDNIALIKKKGTLKLYALNNNKYVNKKVTNISKLGEQSMIYKSKKGLLGYQSFTGDTLTQPIYKKLNPIKNGWAFAQKGKSKMIIDKNGIELFDYPIYRIQPLGLNYIIMTKTGQGLISKEAKLIIKPNYRSIEQYNSTFYKVRHLDNTYSIFDQTGKRLNLQTFKEIKTMNPNIMVVRHKGLDYLYHDVIDNTLSFQQIIPFSTNLYILKEHKHIGMYSSEGVNIVPVEYHNISKIHNAFQVSFFNSVGIYSKDGSPIFNPLSKNN